MSDRRLVLWWLRRKFKVFLNGFEDAPAFEEKRDYANSLSCYINN